MTVNECVSLVTIPCAAGLTVTVSTSIYVGKESEITLSRKGPLPALKISIVKVIRPLILAWVGVAETFKVGLATNVPLTVGVGVWVKVA